MCKIDNRELQTVFPKVIPGLLLVDKYLFPVLLSYGYMYNCR